MPEFCDDKDNDLRTEKNTKHQVTRVTPSLRHKNCLKSVSRQDTVSRLALRRWWSGHPGSNWPSHHWANQNATAL